MNNNAIQHTTYIHFSCRTYMNNKTRAKQTSDAQNEQVSATRITPENASSSTRPTKENFDFKSSASTAQKLVNMMISIPTEMNLNMFEQ